MATALQKIKNEIKQSVNPGQNFEFEVTKETVELFGRSIVVQRISLKADEYKTGWVFDQDTPNCMRCDTVFAFFFKPRHHCRECGFVVCDPCSLHRLKILSIAEPGESRVCTHCYKLYIASLKKRDENGNSIPNTPSNSQKIENAQVEESKSDLADTQQTLLASVDDSSKSTSESSVTNITNNISSSSNSVNNNSTDSSTTNNNSTTTHLTVIEPISSQTDRTHSPHTPLVHQSSSIVEKVHAERLRAEEARKAKLNSDKQNKLTEFLHNDNSTISSKSITERDAERIHSEQERQSRFEEEKRAKLEAFLHVEHFEQSAEFQKLSRAERAELERLRAEQEKQDRLEQDKQTKLAAFLAQEGKDTTSSESGPITARFEEAKRNQAASEGERLQQLKRDPSRSINREGSVDSAFTQASPSVSVHKEIVVSSDENDAIVKEEASSSNVIAEIHSEHSEKTASSESHFESHSSKSESHSATHSEKHVHHHHHHELSSSAVSVEETQSDSNGVVSSDVAVESSAVTGSVADNEVVTVEQNVVSDVSTSQSVEVAIKVDESTESEVTETESDTVEMSTSVKVTESVTTEVEVVEEDEVVTTRITTLSTEPIATTKKGKKGKKGKK